jgi:hypothetical protein
VDDLAGIGKQLPLPCIVLGMADMGTLVVMDSALQVGIHMPARMILGFINHGTGKMPRRAQSGQAGAKNDVRLIHNVD